MINRLINMEVNVSRGTSKELISTPSNSGNYSIQEYAIAFISGMSDTQRKRFKKMLENQIECGMSVAKSYGVDYKEFINEVKKQLEVEV